MQRSAGSTEARGGAAAPLPTLGAQEAKIRMLADAVLTPEECRILVQFADEVLQLGDGYQGNMHPHSDSEVFAGYGFHQECEHPVRPEHRLGLQAILRVRKLMMAHFRLRLLWLDYGHLVRREALPTDKAEVFSHPWHKDNTAKSVQHRTHTAILYLNDEFTGGVTQFKGTAYCGDREVQPVPGRVVGFYVPENMHAVGKLKTGRRYVFNMWFSTHLKIWNRHRKILRHLR